MATEENGVVTENSAAIASTESNLPADEGDNSSDVNWSDMALESDQEDSEDVIVEGDSEVVAAPENAEPPTTAPQTLPSVTADAAPPVTPPQSPPVPASPTTPPPTQEPPAQPQQAYSEWRGKQLESLEKHYAFDEDTSAKLLTEPELVLPKLAAQLHMEVTEHVLRSVMASMPQWVENVNSTRSRETDAEQMFYGANPDLKDPAYKNAVIQMGQAYRAMNPNAPAAEAVKVIGNMVRTAMGLQAPPPPAGQTVVQAAAPAAPTPFMPARGGGGGAVPVPSSSNPWASMAEEFLQE